SLVGVDRARYVAAFLEGVAVLNPDRRQVAVLVQDLSIKDAGGGPVLSIASPVCIRQGGFSRPREETTPARHQRPQRNSILASLAKDSPGYPLIRRIRGSGPPLLCRGGGRRCYGLLSLRLIAGGRCRRRW